MLGDVEVHLVTQDGVEYICSVSYGRGDHFAAELREPIRGLQVRLAVPEVARQGAGFARVTEHRRGRALTVRRGEHPTALERAQG